MLEEVRQMILSRSLKRQREGEKGIEEASKKYSTFEITNIDCIVILYIVR